MTNRNYTFLDNCLLQIDKAIKGLSNSKVNLRSNPSKAEADYLLSEEARRHSAGLMRVNHVGEVCAQALYQGQALTAREQTTRELLKNAALEEQDHLAWCEQRLAELGSHTSYLNHVWYTGSLLLGIIAGLAGDRWSLGFIAETERQVADHLQGHLEKLPENDEKSRAIVCQMRADELQHQTTAEYHGAAQLPEPIPTLMQMMAKVMTTLAYRI